MRRLPHGYTNRTTGDGAVVVKAYDGPDATARRDRERIALSVLAGAFPVPPLLAVDRGDRHTADHERGRDADLTVGFVPGTQAQELLAPDISASVARGVLTACGTTLRRLHGIDPRRLVEAGLAPSPAAVAQPVLVHGDYGPNNLLVDPGSMTVTAVLDWEFVHVGEAVEDLAWCEWIVRTHHPDRIGLLGAFFEAYGDTPPWPVRRRAMLERCVQLLDFCTRWDPHGAGVALWQRRLAETAEWGG